MLKTMKKGSKKPPLFEQGLGWIKMVRLKYLFAIFLSLYFSCDTQKGENLQNGNEIPVTEFRVIERSLDTTWQCLTLNNDLVCVPEGWDEEIQEKYLFMSQLKDSDPNTYFVIIKTKNPFDSIEEYERRVIDLLVEDTIEVLSDYALTGLKYSTKKATFLEAYLEKGGLNYCAYSMLVEKNGVRYDLSLKISASQKEEYYSIFQAVLNSFKANGALLFDEKDKLEAIRVKKALN